MMKTLTIDRNLLEEAQTVGDNLSETETVTKALEEFIQRRKQSKIVERFGSIHYDPGYNYKTQRNVK
jgi:cell fate (sporulation/competence/biofilm development) regulator YlbF (YheA/YmcA/DUF963 family)